MAALWRWGPRGAPGGAGTGFQTRRGGNGWPAETADQGRTLPAVNDAVASPLKALRVALRGPRTEGPMAPDPVLTVAEDDTPLREAS